jgi:hypothetical protein
LQPELPLTCHLHFQQALFLHLPFSEVIRFHPDFGVCLNKFNTHKASQNIFGVWKCLFPGHHTPTSCV